MDEGLNGQQERLAIQRILVAVDASRDSRAALRAAVQMASRFHAELEGLFVEDLNVLRAAQLPLAQELGHYSGRGRPISSAQIEREMRSRVREMRRLFRALIEQEAVHGTFHVTRGMVQTEIRTAAADVDVLIIGRTGWSQNCGKELGAQVRAACSDEAPRVTTVLREGSELASPVLVLYEGSEAGDKALEVGAALVDDMAGPLQILLGPVAEESPIELRARANACLRPTSVLRQYHVLVSSKLPWLVHAIHAVAAGTLVLPGDTEVAQEGRVSDLLSQIDIPLLLVR